MNSDLARMKHLASQLSPRLLEVSCLEQGWGSLRQGETVIGGEPLRVGGRNYEHGLGTHAGSRIRVASPIPLRHFTAVVGPAMNSYTSRAPERMSAMRFAVEANGQRLAESPFLSYGESCHFNVDLPLALSLDLVVEAPAISMAHANWCQPMLETENGKHLPLGQREPPPALPVSFEYDNRPATDFFARNGLQHTAVEMPDHTLHRFVSETDDLRVIIELKAWNDFPAWEWQTAFVNPARVRGKRLRQLNSVQMTFTPARTDGARLLRMHGSFHTESHGPLPGDAFKESFTLVPDAMAPGEELVFGAVGGRPSDVWMPCFDFEAGPENLRLAIGWAGQWQATVTRAGHDFQVRAGLEDADLHLEPGERIQVASAILLHNTNGGNEAAVNLWRRLMTEKVMLPVNHEPPRAPLSFMTWGGQPEKAHLERLRAIEKQRLPVDVYWIDAGWFAPESPNEFSPVWANNVGDWEFDRDSFPQELSSIEAAVHRNGQKLLLWFEPERVRTDRTLAREHPEYMIFNGTENALLDLGDPAAWQWCFDKIAGIIERNRLDWYRQDFNFQPLEYWRRKDAPERRGITEIRYVAGLYRLWQALRLRFPNLMLDNCSSGGRRLDFELLRYSLPLWYSDMQCNPGYHPEYSLTHIAGMARFWPRFGGGVQNPAGGDTYNFRAAMNAGLGIHCFYGTTAPVTDDYPFDWLRQRLHEYLAVRDCFAGDFYCLSAPPGNEPGMWTVFQYDLPESGRGIVQVFRSEKSPVVECVLTLRGLLPETNYRITDADHTFAPVSASGKDLMEDGFPVRITAPRTALLLQYDKA
jgi:alpha-galactosidase